MEYELKTAVVISVDDPDKRGKVQIQLLPEMASVESDLLPWAIPFFSVQGNSSLGNDLPEVNSIVRVLVGAIWQRFYYLPNRFFEENFSFTNVTTPMNNISESPDKTYKNLRFRLNQDGSLEFHNNSTGEHGFIHQSGAYQYFDTSGNIFINTLGNKMKLYNSTATLKNVIKDMASIIQDLVTPLNIIDGHGLPCTFTQASVDLPKIQQRLVDIDNLLKD